MPFTSVLSLFFSLPFVITAAEAEAAHSAAYDSFPRRVPFPGGFILIQIGKCRTLYATGVSKGKVFIRRTRSTALRAANNPVEVFDVKARSFVPQPKCIFSILLSYCSMLPKTALRRL